MLNLIVVAIVFGSIIALATLICGTVLIIYRARQGHRGGVDSEETELIQETYKGLEKLEQRIEALETILMDEQKKKEKDQ
jgi:phage shock protein B